MTPNLYIDLSKNRFWYIIKNNLIVFSRPDGPCIELNNGTKFFFSDSTDDLYAELIGHPLQRNNVVSASIYLHATFEAKLWLKFEHNLS